MVAKLVSLFVGIKLIKVIIKVVNGSLQSGSRHGLLDYFVGFGDGFCWSLSLSH